MILILKCVVNSPFLVGTIQRIVGKSSFQDHQILQMSGWDSMDVKRQSAYLVINPITVHSCGFLVICTTMGHASDSMATQNFHRTKVSGILLSNR